MGATKHHPVIGVKPKPIYFSSHIFLLFGSDTYSSGNLSCLLRGYKSDLLLLRALRLKSLTVEAFVVTLN